MPFIRIERDMLIEELYSVRAAIPTECDDAKTALMKVIQLVQHAPLDEKQSRFPKISIGRG